MCGGTKLNEFNKDLEYSLDKSDDPMWERLYRKAFPFVSMKTITDKNEQKRGRDRYVWTDTGHGYYIEEKKRRKTWGDIALEYISADTTNSPGWIRKELAIDYIAYAFMDTQTAYLFPWALLKRAWAYYEVEWLALGEANAEGFRIVVADNTRYKTYSVAVPTERLLKAVRRAMVIDFSA